MTEKVNDVFKHCFGHLTAKGIAAMMDMTEKEAVKFYSATMIKDLADCGVNTTTEEVEEYLAEQYRRLKEIEKSGEKFPGTRM